MNFSYIGILKLRPSLRKTINDIKQQSNPIYNLDIRKSLEHNKVPWLNDDIEQLSESDINLEKDFLIEIIDRLDKIGVLNQLNKLYKENNTDLLLKDFDYDTIKNSLKSIKSLSNIETSAYLAFYLNKLTKVNEITMYYKALGAFEYNEDFEKKILNAQSSSLPEEIQLYKKNRDHAEQTGCLIISSLEDLKTEYETLLSQNKQIQDNKISNSNLPMKSFANLLEIWKKSRDEQGHFKIENNTCNSLMTTFYEHFNKKIDELRGINCEIDKIEDCFIYGNNALDIENQLYCFKETLLQQLIQYAKKPENENKIAIAYYENQNDTNISSINETRDEVYVFLENSLFPLSFHTNIANLQHIKGFTRLEKSSEIKNYFEKNSNHLLLPVNLKEKKNINDWLILIKKLETPLGILTKKNITDSKKFNSESVLENFNCFLNLSGNYFSISNAVQKNEKTFLDEIKKISQKDNLKFKEKDLLLLMQIILERKINKRWNKDNNIPYANAREELLRITKFHNLDTIIKFSNPFSKMKQALGIQNFTLTQNQDNNELETSHNMDNSTYTKQVSENIQLSNEKILQLQRKLQEQNDKIKELELQKQHTEQELHKEKEKVVKLENQNREQTNTIYKLQRMVNSLLKFCERVRSSRFGRIFFKKSIKELDDGSDIDFDK